MPEFGTPVVNSFPAGQAALKGTEKCNVKIEHTNINGSYPATYLYTDPQSPEQLTIPDSTTYAETKIDVEATDEAVYNVSAYNFKVTAVLPTYNGHSAYGQTNVKIANVAPTLTVAELGEGPDDVFRSKTTGSNYYQLHVTSDQELNSVDIHRDSSDDDGSTIEIPSFSEDPGNSR